MIFIQIQFFFKVHKDRQKNANIVQKPVSSFFIEIQFLQTIQVNHIENNSKQCIKSKWKMGTCRSSRSHRPLCKLKEKIKDFDDISSSDKFLSSVGTTKEPPVEAHWYHTVQFRSNVQFIRSHLFMFRSGSNRKSRLYYEGHLGHKQSLLKL